MAQHFEQLIVLAKAIWSLDSCSSRHKSCSDDPSIPKIVARSSEICSFWSCHEQHGIEHSLGPMRFLATQDNQTCGVIKLCGTFKCIFSESLCYYYFERIFIEVCSEGYTWNKSALNHVVWCWTVKLLPEPMMTQLIDRYMSANPS